MWRSALPLSGSVASVFLWLLSLPHCVSAQEGIHEFALRLRDIVVSGDVAQFMEVGCYPSPCIDDDDVNFVIGSEASESRIRTFLRRPTVGIKIFGPYTYSDELKDSTYAVMYYDPEIVKFDSHGRLSAKQREELWWNGYVETVISPTGNGWGFHGTPFYHGADPPWLEDF